MFDKFPYTNFHELNLDYFINKFNEIFTEWEQLNTAMLDWKAATDASNALWKTSVESGLAAWKTATEADLNARETALRAELAAWKTATEADIGTWETDTLAALNAWKTTAEATFEAIRVQAAASATAAQTAQTAAETAQTAAETAQTAAETAAASVSASAAQIATNTGDISDLKTQLTDLEQSKMVSNLTGVTLLDGFDNEAIEVIKCIKKVEWTAIRAGATLGELPIIRICICVNTEQYPRRIGIYTDENRGIQLTWDGNIATGKVRENGNDNYLTIEFDWDNYTGQYNKTFENSKIEIRNSSINAEITNNMNKINNINITLDNISDIGNYIAMQKIPSRYIAYDGSITEWTNHDNSVIKYYPISTGETVVANGKSVKLATNYPIMIFAENLTTGTIGKIIKYGSNELEDYNFIYTADTNGYVIIAYRTDSGFGELNLYKTFKSSDVLDIKKSAEYNNPMNNETTYNSTYIDGNNRIIDGPQAFTLKKYPVTHGKLYRIVGEWVRLNYSSYPLACFSHDEFTGTTPFQCDTAIIPSGETATAKLYDVEFAPNENGFVYIVSYSAYPELTIYEGFNNENVSETINILTDTKRDFPVKMQLFGDSITDDSWRADGTWATVFENYFPQRLWSISNDAVGGSHMGHGKVNSETGKYHELEYNWVYDLITNESIFKPESDIILISDGTNDFNSSPLGQYSDTQPNTFYGALRSICEYLSAHTKAKIFFCTPIARPTDADATKDVNSEGEKINAYGKTLRDYANAIKEVCAFYQFPVIDCFYEIGWNATNVKPYLDNVGVHPNEIGSNVIAQFIAGNIKKHFGM